MHVSDRRRQARSRGAARVAWVLIAATLIGLVWVGVSRTGPVEEAEVLGASFERGVATFTVACEGQGYCTFHAGRDPRTAKNTRYHWDWGDGTSDDGPRYDHYFRGDDDEYQVELRSTNEVTGEAIVEHVRCTRQERTLVVFCG